MGSRGRSIRLRIYFLVAIPLITMLGLFGYVAYTSITNYHNLNRAPILIRATAVPLTNFVSFLQAERRAAVVYLSKPSSANLTAYQAAIEATRNGELPLQGVVKSPATTDNSTPAETAAINAMVGDVLGISAVQSEVTGKKLSALDAFEAYTKVITDQDAVFQAQTGSMTDTIASSQGFGLISAVNSREDLSEQDALLAGALAGSALTPQERVGFSDAAGRQTDDTLLFQALFTVPELEIYNTYMDTHVPAALRNELSVLQQGVESGLPLAALESQGLSPGSWQQLTKLWQASNYVATTDAANVSLAVDQSLATNAKNRVYETAAAGAAGLILTLLVTILLGRSINRRLTVLRRSALALAHEQLPAVIARLRRGESVDVAAEAPPVLVGKDEIGQVGQAIDAVRQTALRSAVEEARVRQGVNDMFRNLARRNQSLLQRQLTVLDGMERRATDPDVLEDLFKMDHLTTRMRRHAEGLIILSGAAPGRSWSAPVKIIDVMRGAVAEVEDYARVTVSAATRAALAGSAVTDVIHLLAELIENATTLSPPFTQVRVGGEIVANGFAIEIEDRGLGMNPQRLAELNDRLANPPTLNPANTEQLGLFVVGQLARRHGISVTLRPSPYGGTSAVALIPSVLIVEDGPAALTMGGPGAAISGSFGARPAGGPVAGPARAASGAFASAGADGFAPNGAGTDAGAFMTGAFGDVAGSPRAARTGSVNMPPTPAAGNAWGGSRDLAGPNGWPRPNGSNGPNGPNGSNGLVDGTGTQRPPRPEESGLPQRNSNSSNSSTGSIRISGALRHPGAMPNGPGATGTPRGSTPFAPGISETGARRAGRHGTDEVPVVTGVPVSRPTVWPEASFDVFTPIRRPEQEAVQPDSPADAPYPQAYPDFGAQASDASYAEFGSDGAGNNGLADGGYDGGGTGEEGYKGLPRRVRQASLAPELRATAAANSNGNAGAVPRASAESLTVMRNTLSAMQRGWQQGRSESQGDTEGNVNGD
jgi:signal transduction histidine kinase